jgi:hypothetical protein
MARLVCESDPVSKILSTWYLTGTQERKRNKLKDSFTLGPTLGVSYILAFTMPPSLRIVKFSDCPTLSFHIERYSYFFGSTTSPTRPQEVPLDGQLFVDGVVLWFCFYNVQVSSLRSSLAQIRSSRPNLAIMDECISKLDTFTPKLVCHLRFGKSCIA